MRPERIKKAAPEVTNISNTKIRPRTLWIEVPLRIMKMVMPIKKAIETVAQWSCICSDDSFVNTSQFTELLPFVLRYVLIVNGLKSVCVSKTSTFSAFFKRATTQ